jgi:hypothetical protein
MHSASNTSLHPWHSICIHTHQQPPVLSLQPLACRSTKQILAYSNHQPCHAGIPPYALPPFSGRAKEEPATTASAPTTFPSGPPHAAVSGDPNAGASGSSPSGGGLLSSLADKLTGGAASRAADKGSEALEQLKHGGAPAPRAVHQVTGRRPCAVLAAVCWLVCADCCVLTAVC